MKKKLFIGMMALGLMVTPVAANAQGFANVELNGNKIVENGNDVKVKVSFKDITETKDDRGVTNYCGEIVYDNTMLELVNVESTNPNFTLQFNKNNGKFIAYSMSEGIKEDSVAMVITFKSLQSGNTSVDLFETRLYTGGEAIVKNIDVDDMNITIKDKEVVTTTTTTVVKPSTTTTSTSKKTSTTTTSTTSTSNVVEETTTTTTTTKVVAEDSRVEEKNETVFNKVVKAISSFFKNLFKVNK